MLTFLLLTTFLPVQPPATEYDPKQLAEWVAALADKDSQKSVKAREALIKAGPKAKAVIPDLIRLLELKDNKITWEVQHAIDVLAAIGPPAIEAIPALTKLCHVSGYSGFSLQPALAIAKIDGPKLDVTRVLVLGQSKGIPILLVDSAYFKSNPSKVVEHLLTLCADKDPNVRRRSVVVLAGLPEGRFYGEDKILALRVDTAKDAPSVFEKMLTDEDAGVRMAAAHGLSRIDPKQTTKTIPAVIATMTDPKLKDQVAWARAADIFQPIPEEAATALIPLFDGTDYGRNWAIDTLAQLPVRPRLEATLKDGKTARTRAAAATAIGARSRDGAASLSLLKNSLDDREFPVRFASAAALVNLFGRKNESALGVPALIEGLKQEDSTVRFAATKHLYTIGERAHAAVPHLKATLGDTKPDVALEAAFTLVEVARSDAADAVPVLTAAVKGTNVSAATRAATSLGVLGPVAKLAVPELVKRFEAKAPGLRNAATVAAALIDPEMSEKATAVLIASFKQHKGGSIRTDVVMGLARIGPAAKSALPTLLEAFQEMQKKNASYFQVELVLAILAIDPETAKPVVAWIRELIATGDDDDAFDLARQIRKLGAKASPLLAEIVAMLNSKQAYIRECAAVALGDIGPDAKDALPRLKELAEKDTSANTRKLAAKAIKSIEEK